MPSHVIIDPLVEGLDPRKHGRTNRERGHLHHHTLLLILKEGGDLVHDNMGKRTENEANYSITRYY